MISGIFGRQLCLCLAFLSVLLILIPQSSRAFIIDIDAHGEECFFDRVRSGTKITVTFEVTEGGFLDIDVKACFIAFIICSYFSCINCSLSRNISKFFSN